MSLCLHTSLNPYVPMPSQLKLLDSLPHAPMLTSLWRCFLPASTFSQHLPTLYAKLSAFPLLSRLAGTLCPNLPEDMWDPELAADILEQSLKTFLFLRYQCIRDWLRECAIWIRIWHWYWHCVHSITTRSSLVRHCIWHVTDDVGSPRW